MPRPAQTSDWLSLLALGVLWGSAFLLNELALRALTPSMLVAGRICIAIGVLLLAMRAGGSALPRSLRAWASIIVMALLGTVLPFQLTAWGQQHLESGMTAVLMAIMPLFVLGLSHFFLPAQRISAMKAAGLLIGLGGVLCIIGPERLAGSGSRLELVGALAVLGAALSYSVNSVYARRADPADPTSLAAGVMLVAGALSAPAAIIDLSRVGFVPDGLALAAVAFLGLFCTGLATVLYFRLIQGPGPTFVSLVNYLIPAWAVVAGAVFLGEALTPQLFAGMALILTGIAISEFGGRLLKAAPTPREFALQPVRIARDRS